jgi:hypothetical protein
MVMWLVVRRRERRGQAPGAAGEDIEPSGAGGFTTEVRA